LTYKKLLNINKGYSCSLFTHFCDSNHEVIREWAGQVERWKIWGKSGASIQNYRKV